MEGISNFYVSLNNSFCDRMLIVSLRSAAKKMCDINVNSNIQINSGYFTPRTCLSTKYIICLTNYLFLENIYAGVSDIFRKDLCVLTKY